MGTVRRDASLTRRDFVAAAGALIGAVAADATSRAWADDVDPAGSPDDPGAPDETSAGQAEPEYDNLTPLERQVMDRAQAIYDEQIDLYGSVDGYVTHISSEKAYYEKTLNRARLYGQQYDFLCNFSEAFASVALGALSGNASAVASPLLDMIADEAIEQSFLNEVAKDFSGISAEEFIYGEATLGGEMIKINGLRSAMEPAEENGGRFANAEDAARFILVYQRNRAGFAALRMGKDFYIDQINRDSWDMIGDMFKDLAISAGLGAILPDSWIAGYVSGKAVENLENILDGIVAELDNPHVNKWRDELLLIEQETRAIFTAPLVYTVSRPDGLMGDSPEWWGKTEPPTPEQLEALNLYREFEPVPDMPAMAAAQLFSIVDMYINQYGTEYVELDSSTGTYSKAGLVGGWICEMNADGVLGMLMIARKASDLHPELGSTMPHYEFWSWDGRPNREFYGELAPGEHIDLLVGAQAGYIEVGDDTSGRRLLGMTDAPHSYLTDVEALPDEGSLRRIPVARGGNVNLANSKAFVGYLASAAAPLAQQDPTSILEFVRYIGDHGACRMGANRARAFADSIAAEWRPDVDGTDSRFLQAMLVDAGGDGYPLLVKVLANSYYLLEDGESHFIADAIFNQYRGSVSEYPFVEEVGLVGDPQMISIGLIGAEQRHSAVPVLKVTVWGRALDGDRSAYVDAYYFSDEGYLTPFHTMATISGPDGDVVYWDGERCYDPDGALYDAALDYDGHPVALYAKNFADQNAALGTAADIMEAVLRAYADSGVPDEQIRPDLTTVELGAIYYGEEDSPETVQVGASLAELLRGKTTTTYDPHLAYALVALATSAYNRKHIVTSLNNLGLFTIDQRNYYDDYDDENYGPDSVGFCVAKGKTVDDRTLVCVPIRGTYGPIEKMTCDWRSDFHLGEAFAYNTWHKGFDIASHEVFEALSGGTKGVDTSAVYVICGHSRGGAVGNLLAVLLQRAGVPKQNVFCYNFACPDTARGSQLDWNPFGVHGNIWNIGRPSDPVSLIPGIVGDTLRAGVIAGVSGGSLVVPSNPLSAWGKFGRSYWYVPDWGKTADLVPDLSFAAHEPATYIELLSHEPPLSDMREWGEMMWEALIKDPAYVMAFADLADFVGKRAT